MAALIFGSDFNAVTFSLFKLLFLTQIVHGYINVNRDDVTDNRTTWDKREFPNPQQDLEKCGRGGKTSWVCDPDGLITTSEADSIDRILSSIRSESDCACKDCISGQHGYTVSLALVPDISDNGGSISDTSVSQQHRATRDFAEFLRTTSWDFGICSDDVVIVLVKNVNIVELAIGTKAAEQLSEECLQGILDENKGKISRGDNVIALNNIVAQLRKVFTGTHQCVDNGFSWYYVVGPIIVVIALVVYIGLALCRGCNDDGNIAEILCCTLCYAVASCRDS